MPTKTAGRKPKYSIEELKRILKGPLEVVIDRAEAYWLEERAGQKVPPESDRTLVPLFHAIGLILQGRDPDFLKLFARLANGDRFWICGGIGLVDIAEHAAGIPARPRTIGVGPMRVHVPPSRRVVVDPISWRAVPRPSEFQLFEAESILFSPTHIDDTAPRKSGHGPTELVLDGAEAYWLEDRDGERIGPESDRSLAPMYLLVGLAREGRDTDKLTLVARLAGGKRFEIDSGPELVELATRTTGIPVRPPSPLPTEREGR